MSLRDYKITQGDIETKGVVAAPNVMSGDPQANKRIFDRLIREAVAEKFNDLVDELVSSGVEVILKRGDDSIQYIRLNADNVLEVSTDGVEYEATGSSGHLILDKDGAVLPQRSRMRFLNSNVTDEDGVTVVEGIKGDPGPQGERGERGLQGERGIQGLRGQVFVPTVNDDGLLSWVLQEPTTTTPASRNIRGPQGIQGVQGQRGETGSPGAQGIQGVQGIQGPQGIPGRDGADGRSFAILGIYTTLQELLAEHPVGAVGDAYAVGTTENNTVYNWNEERQKWENLGPLRGPAGPQGEQGVPGIQGTQGIPGVQGPQGIPGVQGSQGIQGPEGPQGPRGYPSTINGEGADETGNFTLNAEKVGAIDAAEKGAAGGVAELDVEGKVPEAQLPEEMTPAAHAASHKKGGSDQLTAADVDAAPAGFGLGGIGKPLTSADDINTIWQNGWYYWWTDIPANAPLDRAACGMRVYDSHTNGTQYKACQAVRIMNSGNYNWHNTVFRTIVVDKVSGKSVYVSEWEYLTPMMDAGVEYRTTERYQGKAVYTKLVDCGYLPNSASKNVPHGITGATEYTSIRLCATAGQNCFELAFTDQNSVNIVGDNIQIKTVFSASNYKATVTVKYTKD